MRLIALCLVASLAGAPAPAQTGGTLEQAKTILQMTQENWVAVRLFDGRDLLYFTHLEVYRCSFESLRYAVNGGKMQAWEMPPCPDEGQLMAPIPEDHLPYAEFPPDSVEKVTVEIVYTDGTIARAAFDRAEIETP